MNHDTYWDKDCDEGLGCTTERDTPAQDKERHRLNNTRERETGGNNQGWRQTGDTWGKASDLKREES